MMSIKKTEVGTTYGKLTVLKRVGIKNKNALFLCKCECGNTTEVTKNNLVSGNTKSCGCISSRNTMKERFTKHGLSNTRIYETWCGMKKRCENPNSKSYKNYGMVGITICEEWKTFDNFYKDMIDGYSDELTIERIDNNKGYSKENCEWIHKSEQSKNRKTNTYLTYNGETLCLTTMAKKYGIERLTLRARLKTGMSIEEAIEKPLRKKNGGK